MRTYNSHALSWRGNDLRCAGKTIAGITPDQTYAGMWRVVRPDGRLSDMVNKTRAKDAATAIALSILNWGAKKRPAEPVGASGCRIGAPSSRARSRARSSGGEAAGGIPEAPALDA
jgi:hypothetical protein